MLSNDTTVGGIVYLADSLIRVQSQIQTNAFPLEYKGFGIGIYFTETGCPKTSYLNTTLYEQGNTCERGVRTHPTGVARILQTRLLKQKSMDLIKKIIQTTPFLIQLLYTLGRILGVLVRIPFIQKKTRKWIITSMKTKL